MPWEAPRRSTLDARLSHQARDKGLKAVSLRRTSGIKPSTKPHLQVQAFEDAFLTSYVLALQSFMLRATAGLTRRKDVHKLQRLFRLLVCFALCIETSPSQSAASSKHFDTLPSLQVDTSAAAGIHALEEAQRVRSESQLPQAGLELLASAKATG